MTINNYGSWKNIRKGLLLTVLAMVPAMSQAATIKVAGQTQAVIGATGVFSQDSLSDSKASAYLFDKPTAVVTMELDNGMTVDVALDFEQLVRRDVKVIEFDGPDHHGSLDGTPARGLIQEILLAKSVGNINLKGGYGDIHFEERPAYGLSRTMQENTERRGERLLISASTQISNANLFVTLYDGKGRKAIDLARSIDWSDVMNVQDGAIDKRLSVMAGAELGNEKGKIRVAFANERNGSGDVDNKIALSAGTSVPVGSKEIALMAQYIRHFTDSMKNMDSIMIQASSQLNEKTAVYVRGEAGDITPGGNEALQATVGLQRQVYSNSLISVDAIGELRFAKLDSEANEDTAWGALVGLRVSAAKEFSTDSKN